MNKPWPLLMLLAALALQGCDFHGHDDHDHGPTAEKHDGHGGDAHDDHGDHGHGAGNIAVTDYTATTELFVEFPKLVKGEDAGFAAHMTHLKDSGFLPVDTGQLIVTLSGGGAADEKAEAGPSATAGIFRPVLRPVHEGVRRLTLQWVLDGQVVTHDLGEVTVYPDAESAAAEPEAEEGDEGIGFTKEQQWKIPFANEVVSERTFRASVPAMAVIRARAGGEAIISAPGAGLVRASTQGFPFIGMPVKAGQTVANLIPLLGAEQDAAALSLAVDRASIELTQARQERERLESLFKLEAIPEKRLIDARSRERLAIAELNAARGRSASYVEGSSGIALKSPINGSVVAVGAGAGAAVSDGQMIVHVADLDRIWLEARVAESDLGRLGTPNGAFFTLDGTDTPYMAEVGGNATLVGSGGLVDPDTRTVPVIFEMPNPDGRLRIGMNLRTSVFTGERESALAVPSSALVDDNGQAVIYIQTEGESFERRVVTTGTRDGRWVAIRSGVAAGERVVTVGAYQVRLAATAPAALGHGHAH